MPFRRRSASLASAAALALALPLAVPAQVVERCAWTGSAFEPAFDQVLTTPVVADLDRDGVAEIVFVSYGPRGAVWPGVLRAMSGADCSELFAIADLGCRACVGEVDCRDLDVDGDGAVFGTGGLAVGDLDGDGTVEIVALLEGDLNVARTRRLVALGPDGTFRWCSEAIREPNASSPTALQRGLPWITDMDGDGLAEIVVGAVVFSHDGRLEREDGNAAPLEPSVVADVDGDGSPEVVTGATALDAQGEPIWDPRFDPARPDLRGARSPLVVDFERDGLPEVVVPAADPLRIHVLDGVTGWSRSSIPYPWTPGCGSLHVGPGAPSCADLDGDGVPELAYASGDATCVLRWDPTPPATLEVLWCHGIDDCTSGILSPSWADVDGDDVPEILVRDERDLWILRADGTVVQREPSSSLTGREPVVAADVGGGCGGELVVAANRGPFGAHHGIRVFEGFPDPLPPYRPIWNQHAYSVAAVGDDGTIAPALPTNAPLREQGPAGTVFASTSELWPPNHQFVPIAFEDAAGRPVSGPMTILSVRQDEPVDEGGDGRTTPDARIVDGVLHLRAERSGKRDGRVYHVEVLVGAGACATRTTVTACVPHSRSRRAAACVDGGPMHDSLAE